MLFYIRIVSSISQENIIILNLMNFISYRNFYHIHLK
ncbi:hypothetical protein pb186bvf_013193 [Paramecium bursaria]